MASVRLPIKVSRLHCVLLVLFHFGTALVIGCVISAMIFKLALLVALSVSATLAYREYKHYSTIQALEFDGNEFSLICEQRRKPILDYHVALLGRLLLILRVNVGGERMYLPLFYDSMKPDSYRILRKWFQPS